MADGDHEGFAVDRGALETTAAAHHQIGTKLVRQADEAAPKLVVAAESDGNFMLVTALRRCATDKVGRAYEHAAAYHAGGDALTASSANYGSAETTTTDFVSSLPRAKGR